jgi:outer membrane receptor protein involved in Fe transport
VADADAQRLADSSSSDLRWFGTLGVDPWELRILVGESMKKPLQYSTVGASVAAILGTLSIAAYAPLAVAGEQADSLEEVTVTGSRIQRRDAEANSPLVTVEAASLESRTGLNVESFLNQLPNFNPATTPVTSQGDVQITPVNSVGISSISLRGFGPNRNLVLVDGHRTVPINPLMVTDINGIPSAMIERVEIISGGASAVYGADAIGGVTNFILRDNFEGLELDAQYGLAEKGDAQETRAYATFGTNFADNRGNVTFSAEWYNRGSALERERDFYTDAWSDPTVGGDFFLFGYNGYAATAAANAPPVAIANAIFAPLPAYPNTPPANGATTGVCNFNSCVGADFRFNADSSIFVTAGNSQVSRITAGGGRPIDGREYAIQNVYDNTGLLFLTPGIIAQAVKWNNQDVRVLGPQERYSMFGSSRYQITDSLEFYARGTWAQSKTRTLLLPTNASSGWEATIPFNPTTDSPVDPTLDYTQVATIAAVRANPAAFANPNFIPTGTVDPDGAGPLLGAQHPVTPELAMLLLSRPAAARTSGWMLQTFPLDSFDQRATLNTSEVWNIETGLRFDVPVGDWTGELYYSHGQSSSYNQAFGNNSLTRWRNLVTQPDYARGAALSANTAATNPGQAPPARPGFGGADVTCTSGFYDMIFKADTRPSDDCRTAVQANLQSRTSNQQDIAEVNLQGGLFDLPAGEVRAAVGAQYRNNASQFLPDILQSTSSFMDQVIGVYPTGYLDASADVVDYYAELLVPVLSDLPFLQKMELELGGRYSDYEWTDSEFTYKALASFQFTNWLRLRGGYNRATRAPNLGELFLNQQEIFTIGGANFSDPCSGRSTAPFGAGGVAPDPVTSPPNEPPTQLAAGQTVAGATSTYLICQAQMGLVGRNFYYGGPGGVPPGTNAVGGSGGLFNWVLQQGNPELTSEVADTWSVGLVFGSPWSQPWISGFQMTLDWWKVDISDAIQQYSIDYARYLCYGTNIVSTAAAAASQAASDNCRNVSRDPNNGQPLTVLLEYANLGTISVSGVDMSLNWRADFADLGLGSIPGALSLNAMASYFDYYKTKASPLPFDVEIDWKGSLGPTLTGTNPGAYSWRLNAGVGYQLDRFSVNLRWRHLPSVRTAAMAQERSLIENNERVAAGGEGTIVSYTPTTAIAADSYDAFDLSFNWEINDTLSLRGGIDNLFDTDPVITGASAGRPYDPSLTLAQNQANLAAVCSADALTKGCVNPTGFSLATTGAGTTSPGFYDTIGRRFFLGLKARF